MNETVNQGTQQAAQQEPAQEKTFNQAELDKIVGERLAREREKYADYEALKEKASKLDTIEEANKTELQKITEKAAKLESELSALKKEKEVRDIRETVAKETGIPVSLLTGNTADECKAQAAAIKAYANPTYPTVTDHGEPQNQPRGTAQEQFTQWANAVLNG